MNAVEVVVKRLRTLTAAQASESDRELLGRFVRQRDDAAFAALLERHGPMVLGVARRGLRDEQLAEDVLQATFLVLARTAATIRKQPSLGSWLHGVAWRLARKAKRETERAGRGDTRARPGPPGPAVEVSWREVRQILDDEIQRLPERYRLPVVLCYLEGRTRDEAAAQLGYRPGRLKGLLERGREKLRRRLVRRGLAPAAAAPVLLTESALAAPVPPVFAVTTLRVALGAAAGDGLKTSGVSISVQRLAESGLPGVCARKLALALVATLGLGGLGLGVGLLADQPHPVHSCEIANDPAVTPPAEESVRRGGLEGQAPNARDLISPPSKPEPDYILDQLPAGAGLRFGTARMQEAYMDRFAHFSPDGKWLATAGNNGPVTIWNARTGQRVETRRAHGNISEACWRSDGTIAAIVSIGPSGFLMEGFTPGKANGPDEEARLDEAVNSLLRRRPVTAGNDPQKLRSAHLSPDGRWAAGVRGDRTEFYRFTPGETTETVKAVSWVATVCDHFFGGWLSRDNKVFLSHSKPGNKQPRRLLAFDVPSAGEGKLVWALPLPGGNDREPVGCFSLTGRDVVIHFSGGDVELWDGPNGKLVRTFPRVPMCYHHNNGEWGRVDLSPDGKRLALIHRGADGAVGGRVVDVATGKAVCTLRPLPMPVIDFGIGFSPDGRSVARVGRGKVQVWDADTGENACPLPGHRGEVTSVAATGAGRAVVTTGRDYTVRACSPISGAEVWRTGLQDLATIQFATSDVAVLAQDQVWDLTTETPAFCVDLADGRKKPLPGKLGDAKNAYPLAISADGKKVVTLTRGRKKPTWDVWSWPAGEHLVQLPGQPPGDFGLHSCTQAHMSPDGQQLLAVVYYDSPDERPTMSRFPPHPFIERWDLATGKLLDRFEPAAGNPPRLLAGRKGVWS
jgi:RNA polymerase sigma factor (sigma-70 family)